jgi:hypothetical protein
VPCGNEFLPLPVDFPGSGGSIWFPILFFSKIRGKQDFGGYEKSPILIFQQDFGGYEKSPDPIFQQDFGGYENPNVET